REAEEVEDIHGARCLVRVGDSVTTDHISPAGAIRPDSPAGKYLIDHGVERKHFNSYGSRRGNHEVMVRGTFANVRLKNQLVPGSEGTWTVHVPTGEEMTIYDASKHYLADGTPTIVLAGKEYGSGSSRDWAAKGPNLLGVKAAIAESYERIHRSNLLMMGVLPLQFMDGESPKSLGLTGRESFSISGVDNAEAAEVTVRADGQEFRAEEQARGISARNRFVGTITEIKTDGLMAQVELVVTEPARVVALVTKDAVDELALKPGMSITAIVKSTSVMVEH